MEQETTAYQIDIREVCPALVKIRQQLNDGEDYLNIAGFTSNQVRDLLLGDGYADLYKHFFEDKILNATCQKVCPLGKEATQYFLNHSFAMSDLAQNAQNASLFVNTGYGQVYDTGEHRVFAQCDGCILISGFSNTFPPEQFRIES